MAEAIRGSIPRLLTNERCLRAISKEKSNKTSGLATQSTIWMLTGDATDDPRVDCQCKKVVLKQRSEFEMDYILWKTWWYATLYGASSEKRMSIVDSKRKEMVYQRYLCPKCARMVLKCHVCWKA